MASKARRYETPPLAGDSALRQPLIGRTPRQTLQPRQTQPPPPQQQQQQQSQEFQTPYSHLAHYFSPGAHPFRSAAPQAPLVPHSPQAPNAPAAPTRSRRERNTTGPFRLPRGSCYEGLTLEQAPLEYVVYLHQRRDDKYAGHPDLHSALDEYYHRHPERRVDSNGSEASWPGEGSSWFTPEPVASHEVPFDGFQRLHEQYHESEQQRIADMAHLRFGIAKGNIDQMDQTQQFHNQQTAAFKSVTNLQENTCDIIRDGFVLHYDASKANALALQRQVKHEAQELRTVVDQRFTASDEANAQRLTTFGDAQAHRFNQSQAQRFEELTRGQEARFAATEQAQARNLAEFGETQAHRFDQSQAQRFEELTRGQEARFATTEQTQARHLAEFGQTQVQRFERLENHLQRHGTTLGESRDCADNRLQQILAKFDGATAERGQISTQLTSLEHNMNTRLDTLSQDVRSIVQGSFYCSHERVAELEAQIRAQTERFTAKDQELRESKRLLEETRSNAASDLEITSLNLQGHINALEQQRDNINHDRVTIIHDRDTQLEAERIHKDNLKQLLTQSNIQRDQSQADFAAQTTRLQNDLNATRLALAAEQGASNSMRNNSAHAVDLHELGVDEQLSNLMGGLVLDSADPRLMAGKVFELSNKLKEMTEVLRHAEKMRNGFMDNAERLDGGIGTVSAAIGHALGVVGEREGVAWIQEPAARKFLMDQREALELARDGDSMSE